MDKEFLNSLNDWGDVISNTYERATNYYMLYAQINKCPPVKDTDGRSFEPTHLHVLFEPQQKDNIIWLQNYITDVHLLMLLKCNVKSYTLFNDEASVSLPGNDSIFEIYFSYTQTYNILSIRDLYLVNSYNLQLINIDTDNNDITFNDVTFKLFKELIDNEVANVNINDMGLSTVNKCLKILNNMITDSNIF